MRRKEISETLRESQLKVINYKTDIEKNKESLVYL